MSIWYRASQLNNIQKVFSGEGGLYTAARWNYLGRRAVYCSQSISLCTLEWLAHNGLSVSGFDYYRYSIEIPKTLIAEFSIKELPKEWNFTPATDMTRDFAEEHLFSNHKYLALQVPSVIVPEEFNLIINPTHDHFPKVIKTVTSFGRHESPRREI